MAGSYDITTGVNTEIGLKAGCYAVESLGKSTLGTLFPDPLWSDVEGSTDKMDNVKRLPKATSWSMFLDEIDFVAERKPCKTLVIDSIDWAEKLCINHVLQLKGWQGIEDAGYGNGYKYVHEEFAKIFTHLDRVINSGINVLILAHCQVSKFEMPDDQGAYDRYSLKLINTPKCSNSSLVKEWLDVLFFGNFRTVIVKDDKTKKVKGYNGQDRYLYTQRTAAWDAKNRFGLPFEIPYNLPDFDLYKYLPFLKGQELSQPKPIEHEINVTDGMDEEPPRIVDLPPVNEGNVYQEIKERFPALYDLMRANSIKEEDIRRVSASKGYFPEDTPIVNYPDGYVAHIMQYKDEFIQLAKK